MNCPPIKIEWRNRFDALPPCAVIATGDAARALAEKLVSFDQERQRKLKGIGAEKMILILGEEGDLPWTNEAVYLGRDPKMPAKLLPTTLQPNVPLDLFERVLDARFKRLAPFAVLPKIIVPFGTAKSLSGSILENWLARNR